MLLKILAVLVNNIASTTCVVLAGMLALNGSGGWGWFLIAGVITHCWLSFSGDKEKDKDEDDERKAENGQN